MSMEVSTRLKARAGMALLLAILCGCETSSQSSNEPDEQEPWSGDSTRVQETDMETVFSDGWVHANTAHDWSGGTAAHTSGAGASMSISFTGTRIRWIGWYESGAGIARVLIDGEPVGEVDLYSNTIQVRAPVFTSEILELGPHTLTIEATGDANPASTGTMVIVDAFDIADSAPKPDVTRIEETHSSLSFTGDWLHGDTACLCSGGTNAYTRGPDALVSFSFTGTRVRWLGFRKEAAGIARVYVDGALAAEVDLYSETVTSQAPAFTSEVLDHGPHTLLIEAAGTGNPAATDTVVTVDAFDVAGQ